MNMLNNQLVYSILYFLLVVVFTYFYTMVTFDPKEISTNLQRNGGFIPGIRAGKPTAEYLDSVLTHITLPGAVCLAIIAVLPDGIMALYKIPYLVASFFGGTGLLIIVGVMLDTMRQIESHLLMRHYEGFIS